MGAVLGHHPREIRFSHLWLRSLLPGHSPVADELPWITFRAIRWLIAYLKPEMRAFEYGAGGSTFFLAKRVAELVSVEHDEAFHATIAGRLRSQGINNCRLLLRRPEKRTQNGVTKGSYGPDTFWSFEPTHAGEWFENYVKLIDEYPDEHFDLVMVDGRCRTACVKRALSKIKPGGALLLDNSERPAYAGARSLLDRYPHLDLFGIVPWNLVPYQTSVWLLNDERNGAATRI